MTGFRRQIVSGLTWSFVSTLGEHVLQFALGIVLVRLLPPSDFGLMGMVLVFIGFANILSDLGFGLSIIQKQDATDAHYSSVFWLNVAVGAVLAVAFAVLAPFIARFYSQPVLAPLTWTMAFLFLIGSLRPVQHALFRRRMAFLPLAIIELGALTISGVISVVMALRGFGVWSLAVQAVTSKLLSVTGLWLVSGWRPSRVYDRAAIRELWGFSLNLVGFSVVCYWLRNADRLLIGRFLGASPLGIYTRAYTLMVLPLSLISDGMSRVMFPAMSAIQSDKARAGRLYLRTSRAVALLSFPMMVGLFVVAADLVMVVFGEPWKEMIPILRIMSWIGLIESIGTLNGNLYLSQGRTALQFRVGTIFAVIGLVAFCVGLPWGVVGVAGAYAVYSVLTFYPSLRIALGLVDVSFTQAVRNLAGTAICALAMGVLVSVLRTQIPVAWPPWLRLTVEVSSGVLFYAAILHATRLEAYRDVRVVLSEARERRGE